MFVAKNLVFALATVIDLALLLYLICLFAAVVISWFAPRSRHPLVRFLRAIVEPVLGRVRRAMPFLVMQGFDLTPIVVFLIIHFLRRFLVETLYDAAARM
ncbi:MAG: YggT family protein [Candidatus Eisenbacteria bacterium]|nr:YggT family protein [Candidatus Eisenbacteria bacterium]